MKMAFLWDLKGYGDGILWDFMDFTGNQCSNHQQLSGISLEYDGIIVAFQWDHNGIISIVAEKIMVNRPSFLTLAGLIHHVDMGRKNKDLRNHRLTRRFSVPSSCWGIQL